MSGKTILIVEDDANNAEYLNKALADTGLIILQAETGMAAIEKSGMQNIDLVLMDVGLPDITGYEAIRQIKAKKPNLKIILQTTYATSEEQQKAFREGCIDYLSKPIKKDILLNMIKSI